MVKTFTAPLCDTCCQIPPNTRCCEAQPCILTSCGCPPCLCSSACRQDLCVCWRLWYLLNPLMQLSMTDILSLRRNRVRHWCLRHLILQLISIWMWTWKSCHKLFSAYWYIHMLFFLLKFFPLDAFFCWIISMDMYLVQLSLMTPENGQKQTWYGLEITSVHMFSPTLYSPAYII